MGGNDEPTHIVQTIKVKGFFFDSHINLMSFIKLSPPNIKSVSRTVNRLLARTLHRRTLAISLNASCIAQMR